MALQVGETWIGEQRAGPIGAPPAMLPLPGDPPAKWACGSRGWGLGTGHRLWGFLGEGVPQGEEARDPGPLLPLLFTV